MAGLLRYAAGAPAPDPWARVRAGVSRRRRAVAALALAASILLALLIPRPDRDGRIPAGPDAAALSDAIDALDPTRGSVEERLRALDHVARVERTRLIAGGTP